MLSEKQKRIDVIVSNLENKREMQDEIVLTLDIDCEIYCGALPQDVIQDF